LGGEKLVKELVRMRDIWWIGYSNVIWIHHRVCPAKITST
jgi:hypothetical protein